jgi:hypothetical protein
MHRNVEVLIGRLATDPELLRRFIERPLEVLREQGLELTKTELHALAAMSPAAICAFSAELDPRIRKFSSEGHSGPHGEADTTGR